jgi:hypothetical protein
MQLVSLEWIPLFVLLWYRLLEQPTIRMGISSGYPSGIGFTAMVHAPVVYPDI